MVVLITCKNEEDPIKTEGARVLIKLYIDLSDVKGRLLRSMWSENQTQPSLYACPRFLQE